jgi:hypothetical protein
MLHFFVAIVKFANFYYNLGVIQFDLMAGKSIYIKFDIMYTVLAGMYDSGADSLCYPL